MLKTTTFAQELLNIVYYYGHYTYFCFQGSATIGGHGCMIATYGCPKHGGPADGHLNTTSGRYQVVGQAHPGEDYCLIRARDFWYYCGASPNYPVTSVYLPTGIKT